MSIFYITDPHNYVALNIFMVKETLLLQRPMYLFPFFMHNWVLVIFRLNI